MKSLITLTASLLLSAQLFAQTNTAAPDAGYNLGFEKVSAGRSLPDNWEIFFPETTYKDDYKYEADTKEKHGGKYSLRIEQTKATDARSFMSIKQVIPAKYAGKQLEFKAWLKFEGVEDFMGLLIRADDVRGNVLDFRSMQDQKINGTGDWKQYSIKLNIPQYAQKISVAAILKGPGKLWVDDAEILIDGEDISKAKTNPDYDPNAIAYGYNKAASGTVKLKDATLYYETYGQGEPLLLLHGNSQEIYAFNFQIKDLAKKYKVIAVDTRGQGKSTDETTGPLSYDLFAEDMKQLLDSLHIKKTNILGWSDGGNTGLIMAIKYPSYVNKLAVMGANLFPTNEALPDKVLDQIKKQLAIYKLSNLPKAKMQVRLFTMLLEEPHMTFDDVRKIKSPVLVMAGQDDLILEKHTRSIADTIPKAKLVIFKGATHYAPVEIPKVFNETVLNFLGR